LFWVCLVGKLLDNITTACAVRIYGPEVELNPFVRYTILNLGLSLAMIFNFVLTSTLIYLFYLHCRKFWLWIVLCVMLWAVVVNNVINLM